MKKILLFLSLLALTATVPKIPPAGPPAEPPVGPPAGCEILWDTYGVPHIFADTDEGLLYGYGWAQAQAHGNLILRLYGQSRGRGAEFLGETYAEADRWVLLNSIPERAKTWYAVQTPPFKKLLDSFARGVNDYAARNPAKISASVKPFLPVTGVDLLAHSMRVIHYQFVAPSVAAKVAEAQLPDQNGSNTWAIGPSRSASGKALLLTNPHLPWQDFYTYFEAQLHAPGTSSYGICRVGFPCMTMFFNDDVATAQTVNTNDGQDFYQLTLKEGGYLFDGEVKAFSVKSKTLKIRQEDGSLKEEKITVKESVHGPVVAEKSGRAVAMRVAGLDRPGMLQEYWDLMHAKNLNEFQRVLSRLQVPMFTYSYADRDGHILNLFNAEVPRRNVAAGVPNDYKTWNGLVPGDKSENLWKSYLSYDELPKSVDPPGGWLQNCNESPWTVTFPMPNDPAKFPAYLAPPPAMSFRTQRSVRMLMEDDKISLDELIQYKHSTRMELADRILDDLEKAVGSTENSEAKQALAVLKTWDRQCNADSRGAVLFEAFVKEWAKPAGGFSRISTASPLFAKPWDTADPINTPDGIAQPAEAVKALETAARQVKKDHGGLDVAWGAVYHFKIPASDGTLTDVPANGGPGPMGVFRVMTFAATGRAMANSIRPFHGDTYVAAIELSTPIKARTLIGYGNASQPGSQHHTDQLPLMQQQKLRTAWLTKTEILQHLELRERL